MIEIRIHGRGGQGAVIASKILACAFFAEGKFVQSFPKFGVERRGAPVEAFLRYDDKKILLRNNIYTPHHLIVLDHTLIEATNVTSGLQKGGWIIINSSKKPQDFCLPDYRVACVDANELAMKYKLGSRSSPIVNTAILGAFAKATQMLKIDSIVTAVIDEVPIKAEDNAQAAKDAFEQTTI
ncbi:MAG: 2-oxoacid:acceptor oxidoreductase family protein [bacterium]|nr:2-oxoacid:acceptor oxidoreductase family protein [bacterium]MBU1917640.1 2-oxoacid:acceptor oxidoreductase family protein [bacterium]